MCKNIKIMKLKEIYKKEPFHIMDCTLRDGSYAINFNFTKQDTLLISKHLDNLNIPYIEVGHGIGLGASEKGYGKSASTSKDYILAGREGIKKGKLGVFCIPGIAKLEQLKEAIDCGIDFVRIGVDVNNYEIAEEFVNLAKKKSVMIAVNFLKSYAYPIDIFLTASDAVEKMGADLVYIVDSAGGMLSDELEVLIDEYKLKCSLPFGFHGHNNLGLVNSNVIMALKKGAKIVDTSLQGFGRSSGNASTEHIVMILMRLGIDLEIDILMLLEKSDMLMKKFINSNNSRKFDSLDAILGFSQFHSSYTSKIIDVAKNFSIDPKLLILEYCLINKIDVKDDELNILAKQISKKKINKSLNYEFKNYFGNEQ